MGKKITAEEFPQLWYHKKQIDCNIIEYDIKDNGSTIHLRIAPFNNEFHDIFSHKDYHNYYVTFFGENLNDKYSPLILICAICKKDIREKGDFPVYSKKRGIICVTCCLGELKKESPENSKIFDYLLNERKKNQIKSFKSFKIIQKLDICRVCGDLLHYPEKFSEDFNEEYKICCKCQRALESKVKGLNRVRDLKRFKKYEMRFRDIFFIDSKTLSKVIKVKDGINYKI